jgi:hypothetical protein
MTLEYENRKETWTSPFPVLEEEKRLLLGGFCRYLALFCPSE